MRPTRRGVLVGLCSLGAAVLGWLLGLPEVSVLAAAGFGLLAGSALWVGLRPVRLRVRRSAHPQRLPAGDPCEIHLRLENPTRRPSPVLALRDRVSRFGTAQLMVAPIAPRRATTASYSLPSQRRGRYHVGPLVWVASDPFGLVRRATEHPGTLAVVITPRTWPLRALPAAAGDEPDHGTRSLTSASTVDEEFASLRDYVPGDDVRRIHWRSTARRGTPVVREFDVPWQRRTTVVADLRTDRHDDASFERLVSVVASVVELAAANDELVRVVSDLLGPHRFAPAAACLDGLLDQLAVLGPAGTASSPADLLDAVAGTAGGGTGRVVTVVGGLVAGERAALERSGRRAGLHVVVLTGTSSAPNEFRHARVVTWDGRDGLDEAWARGVPVPAAAGVTSP